MYMVYWSEAIDDAIVPRAASFAAGAMAEALSFAETLRRRQSCGESVCFVTLCSENPNSVGRPGVADPPADYAWKKRRP
ncbi:hypothetical protein [uncultured Paraburkholderia sp.]|uniref:hypothetical protein n=1 Tax=uncultured Paraburkholderia sp. TaxID=1822466 RepID=UPI0025973335|nr:hypothetical protein [uncultured Paraburkholderia sp.]